MTKQEKIEMNVVNNLGLSNVEKYGCSEVGLFVDAAKRYIKAIKEGRIICNIDTVSSSGMSRTIKFLECSKGRNGYNYLNFYKFMIDLGFTPVKQKNTFRISGCGMDMIFHTNCTIINNLHRLGFINKKQCTELEQKTPSVI